MAAIASSPRTQEVPLINQDVWRPLVSSTNTHSKSLLPIQILRPSVYQFCGSILEGKPLRPPVYIAGRAHKQDVLGLSLSPFCTLKEIEGSGSLWIDGMGAETFLPDHCKPLRKLDLEKLLEDDADESSDLEGTAEELKGSNLPDSTESFQDLGSSVKIASTGPKSEPYNSQVGMDSFPKDPITCSQDSSIQKS
ncbi:hypothetical protein POTOM_057914 [Populus tomentosa]|uniref:Uncharacterized protein n=1 Tax=Populus tomentosa TaxID=118781 RepID=A0A8X7XXU2_POPTO|nr:hypothetical protein POTOM_057914 [Populus tomentosa]